MKTKEYLAFGFLGLVLIILGSFLVSKISGTKVRTAEVEVIRPITSEFNEEAKSILLGRDTESKTEVFSIPINLQQGLGSNNPFRTE